MLKPRSSESELTLHDLTETLTLVEIYTQKLPVRAAALPCRLHRDKQNHAESMHTLGLVPELMLLHHHGHMGSLSDVEIALTIKIRRLYHIPL